MGLRKNLKKEDKSVSGQSSKNICSKHTPTCLSPVCEVTFQTQDFFPQNISMSVIPVTIQRHEHK